MPIQQMFLGIGSEDDVFQIRVWQSAASLGSGNFHIRGYPQNYFQYSDGSYLLSAKSNAQTNIQTTDDKTMHMCITNTAITGFDKSVNMWSDRSSDYPSIYPYRGSRSSGKDMTIFIQAGHEDAWQGSESSRDGRWIMIQDSLANNCANLKKFHWHPNGYYTDWGFTVRSKDGSNDNYWFVCEDYASTPSSRSNVRWGDMSITSSAISMSNIRRLGGDSTNGTGFDTWTSDSSNLYIHGTNNESSRSKPYIMKCTGSGITWYREHHVGGQNNYGGGACEVDSSGNVYYVARMRKNNAWQPVIIKLNSSGTTQYSLSWDDNQECFGSAINGSKLYLAWRASNDIIITEHDTSDGSINWQNKINFNSGSFAIHQFASGSMKLNKDNNLDIYVQMTDTGSVIYADGAGLISGIPSDGSLGNGKVGSQITYATSTDIPSPSSYTSFSTVSSNSQTESTVSNANNFTNYTGSEIESNNTDSQLTNINKN